eukprot:Gb_12699 [translate_table: standard]
MATRVPSPFARLPQNLFQAMDKSQSLFGFSEKPLPPPPPCVEVFPSNLIELISGPMVHLTVPADVVPSEKYASEPVNLHGGLTLLKGRVNTADVFGVSNSDLVPGKYEGGLKLWESSLDLINTLIREIQDGQLSFKGKRVLEVELEAK